MSAKARFSGACVYIFSNHANTDFRRKLAASVKFSRGPRLGSISTAKTDGSVHCGKILLMSNRDKLC
jgi:hypothetical protein